MNRLKILALTLSVFAARSHAQDLPASPSLPNTAVTHHLRNLDPDHIEVIERLVQREMEDQGIPGLSVAVAVGNQLVYADGFGLADVENKVPVTTETMFRTASIAKTLTAVVVMSLVEDGKIELDTAVQAYCPAYPEKRWPLTVRQLLGHLGGVRHYKSSDESLSTRHFFSLEAALDTFKEDPLLHKPGSQFLYSSFGFNLLGSVAEGASGKTFAELLDEKIFSMADMKNILVDDHYALIPHRSRGYERPSSATVRSRGAQGFLKAGELYNAPLHDTSMKIPGGGLISTPSELVRFANALNKNVLLKPATRELMWTQQITSDGKTTNYGLGWRIKRLGETKIIYHGGSQSGTRTSLYMVPKTGTTIAIMSNLRCDSLHPLAAAIVDIVSPEPKSEEK